MAKSLAQIQAQIEKLQAQAEQVKKKEVAGVVERIKVAIAHYGLTAVDLGFEKRMGRKPGSKNKTNVGAEAAAPKKAGAKKTTAKVAAPKAKKKAAAKKPAGVAKYADGTGNTWTGNGKRPKWFLDAIAGGKTAEDLLVKPEA